jgi:hypothetical protein
MNTGQGKAMKSMVASITPLTEDGTGKRQPCPQPLDTDVFSVLAANDDPQTICVTGHCPQ